MSETEKRNPTPEEALSRKRIQDAVTQRMSDLVRSREQLDTYVTPEPAEETEKKRVKLKNAIELGETLTKDGWEELDADRESQLETWLKQTINLVADMPTPPRDVL